MSKYPLDTPCSSLTFEEAGKRVLAYLDYLDGYNLNNERHPEGTIGKCRICGSLLEVAITLYKDGQIWTTIRGDEEDRIAEAVKRGWVERYAAEGTREDPIAFRTWCCPCLVDRWAKITESGRERTMSPADWAYEAAYKRYKKIESALKAPTVSETVSLESLKGDAFYEF